MPYSITCSTKILTLAIAQFFLLVGILCEFAMVPGVYILEEVHSSNWRQRYTHSAVQSLKKFKPLFAITLLCQGYCWIEKKKQHKQLCYGAYNQTR